MTILLCIFTNINTHIYTYIYVYIHYIHTITFVNMETMRRQIRETHDNINDVSLKLEYPNTYITFTQSQVNIEPILNDE